MRVSPEPEATADDLDSAMTASFPSRPRRSLTARAGAVLRRPEDLPAVVAKRLGRAPTRPRSTSRVFIYTRYSTDQQEEKSEERQSTDARAYVTGIRGDVLRVFSDRGISGTEFEARPQLMAMLEAIRRGECDMVVIESLDRLSRRLSHLLYIFDELEVHRIELHDITSGKLDRVHVVLRGYVGEEGRIRLLALTKAGKRNAVRGGRMMQRAAYGFCTTPGEPGVHVRDERVVANVLNIFRWACDGLKVRAIARKLNADGVPPPSQGAASGPRGEVSERKLWSPTTVMGIIRNPIYIGWVRWGATAPQHDRLRHKRIGNAPTDESEWIIVEMPELRILDDAVWADAQLKVGGRPKAESGHVRTYLLTGKIVCGACGSRMVTFSSTGMPMRYACDGRERIGDTHCVHSASPRLEFIEDAVVAAVFDGLVTPEAAGRYETALRTHLSEVTAVADARRAQITRELSGIDVKLHRSFCEDDMRGFNPQRIARYRYDLETSAEALRADLDGLPRSDDMLSRLRGLDTLRAGIERMLAEVPFRPSDPEGVALKAAFRDVVSRVAVMPPDADGLTRLDILVDAAPRSSVMQPDDASSTGFVLTTSLDHRAAVMAERRAVLGLPNAGLEAAAADGRHDLSDAEWLVAWPFFEGFQGRVVEPRALFDGLICLAREGGQLRNMPKRFGGAKFAKTARYFVISGRFDDAVAALRGHEATCVQDIDLSCFETVRFKRQAPKRRPDPARAEQDRVTLMRCARDCGPGSLIAMRCIAVALVLGGEGIRAVASEIGMSVPYVRLYWTVYLRDGVEAFRPRSRQPRISAEQFAELGVIAGTGVDPDNPDRMITIQVLRKICKDRFGIEYAYCSFREILRREGIYLGSIVAAIRKERRMLEAGVSIVANAKPSGRLNSRVAQRARSRAGHQRVRDGRMERSQG